MIDAILFAYALFLSMTLLVVLGKLLWLWRSGYSMAYGTFTIDMGNLAMGVVFEEGVAELHWMPFPCIVLSIGVD